ncbi:MAG: nitroreductase family protein [Clostridiaceae bacterium]
MDVKEAIFTRRSGRYYTDEYVKDEDIDLLIKAGTMAATASAMEPWGFVVIRDEDEIKELNRITKISNLKELKSNPSLEQYRAWFENEKFSVFNKAKNLIAIYGNTDSHFYKYDCSLCAANIMLLAHSMNIGTCWVGFGHKTLNTPEFKKEHNVPEKFDLVATLTLGYSRKTLTPPVRREPLIFSRK